jgi:hypothetical protein
MRRILMALSLACGVVMADDFYTPPADEKNLERQADTAANLPNVLLIGDSISIGYIPVVADLLKGTANVSRPQGQLRRHPVRPEGTEEVAGGYPLAGHPFQLGLA